jgi:hypothetical protein
MNGITSAVTPVKSATKNMSVYLKDLCRTNLNQVFDATKAEIVSLSKEFNDPSYNAYNVIKRTGNIIDKDKKGNYIPPDNKVITIVSNRYHLTQHEDVFNNVIDVLDENNIDFSIRKLYIDQRPGKNRIYGNLILNDVKVNIDGSDISPTIDVFNSTDGSMPAGILFGAYRFKCENGMMTGVTFDMQKMIHTPSIIQKLNFGETYEKVLQEFDELTKSIEMMKEIKFNDIMLETLKAFGFNKAFIKNYPIIVEKYLLNNDESISKDTLWSLYSTATNYISNYLMLKNYSAAINSQKKLKSFIDKQLSIAA